MAREQHAGSDCGRQTMSDWVLPALDPGEAASGLEIRLFGPMAVRIGPCPLPRLRSRKGLWLLALLALRAGRDVERDWLAGTLWPDCSQPDSRRSLRQSLHDLRLALGPEAGRLTGEAPQMLRLDVCGAFVDVLAFDAAHTRGDLDSLEAAVRLYRGSFLEDCTEAWSLQERRQREQTYLAALERLAAAATARREYAAAASWLRLAVGADPYREELQRALMEALAGGDNPSGALLAYRQFRALLCGEMAAEPSEATTALFRRLREKTRARPRPHLSEPSMAATTRSADTRRSTAPGPRGSLPHPLSAFVGRERELLEIGTCLAGARLVTLTGAGGIGKTRLAIQAAEECAGEYADGAWFVDLAPLAAPTSGQGGPLWGGRAPGALVSQAVARALRLQEAPGFTLTETLQEALSTRRLLLVLDNCEHLIDACARLADALLSSSPHLRILATSRQALGLTGEISWSVPPLSLPPAVGVGRWALGVGSDPVPPNPQPPTPNALLDYEAIHLFVERAAAASPGFALGERNAAATVQVCRALDGIPLAIELAAARLRALSIEQIAARLDDRFCLLTGGSRAALPRQQTLRATIDWSYELLSEPERVLMRRLSVFAGGWTLAAAEAVCSDFGFRVPDTHFVGTRRLDFGLSAKSQAPDDRTPLPDPIQNPKSKIQNEDVLELLTSLVEKSVVVYKEQEAGARYWLLETVRQYFSERLLESGEGQATRGRHLDCFLALAEEAERQLTSARQGEWLDRLEMEHDNLRAALAFSSEGRSDDQPLTRGNGHLTTEMGLRLAGALWRFWSVRGYMTEGRERLAQALARAPGATAGRAKALETAGSLAYQQADYHSARLLQEESLAIRRKLGDRLGIATSLRNLGLIAHSQRDPGAARSLHQESLAIGRELGNRWGIAASLNGLGRVADVQKEYAVARSLYEESLAIRRELGDRTGVADSLRNLGSMAHAQGDYAAARPLYEESLAIRRELGDRPGIAKSLRDLGLVAYNLGDHGAARSLYEERLAISRELGDRLDIAASLEALATLASEGQGQPGTGEVAGDAERFQEHNSQAFVGPNPQRPTPNA